MERVDGEFYIPTKIADLEDPEKTLNGYKVDVVLDIKAVPIADRSATIHAILHDLLSAPNQAAAIHKSAEKFDTLYSFIKVLNVPGMVPKECRLIMGRDLSQCLQKSVRTIAGFLPKVRNDPESPNALAALSLARSGVKMYCFLLAHLVGSSMSLDDMEIAEGFHSSQAASSQGRGRAGGRGGTRSASAQRGKQRDGVGEDGLDVAGRENTLRCFVEVLSPELVDMWRGGMMDEALTNLFLKSALHMVGATGNVEEGSRSGGENPVAEGLLHLLCNLTSRYTKSYTRAIERREAENGRPSQQGGGPGAGDQQGPLGCPDPNNLIIAPLVDLMTIDKREKAPVAKFCCKLIKSIDDGTTIGRTPAQTTATAEGEEVNEEEDAGPRNSTQSVGARSSLKSEGTAATATLVTTTWAAKFVGWVFEAICQCALHDATGDAAKNVALFLEEEARVHCSAIHSHMEVVLPMLASEAYEIRKGVMTCISEVIVQCYSRRHVKSQEQAVLRDKYLEELLIRVMDVNPFVRMHALKLWSSLCDHATNPVPKTVIIQVLGCAVERLIDRHYLTRRAALQLVETLVKRNTFEQSLSLTALQAKLKEHMSHAATFFEKYDFSSNLAPAQRSSGRNSTTTAVDSTVGGTRVSVKLEHTSARMSTAHGAADNLLGTGEGDITSTTDSSTPAVTDFASALEAARKAATQYGATTDPDASRHNGGTNPLNQSSGGAAFSAVGGTSSSFSVTGDAEADGFLRRILQYKFAIEYTELVHVALMQAVTMLTSKTQSDIVHAIQFIVICAKHRMDAADEAIKRILVMVYVHEPAVQKAVCDCFVSVFFDAFNAHNATKLAKNVARVQKLVILLNDSSEAELNSLERILALLRQSGNDVVDDTLLEAAWKYVSGEVSDESTTPKDQRSALKLYGMLCTSMPRDVSRKKFNIVALMKNNERDNALLGYAFQTLGKESLFRQYVPIDESINPHEHAICALVIHHCCRPTNDLGQWIQLCDSAINCLHNLHGNPTPIYASIVAYVATQYQNTKDQRRLCQLLTLLGLTAVKHLVSIDNHERAQMKKIDDAVQAERTRSTNAQNASGVSAAGSKAEEKVDVMHKELGLGGSDFKRHEVQEQCAAMKLAMLEDQGSVWATYQKLVVTTCKGFLKKDVALEATQAAAEEDQHDSENEDDDQEEDLYTPSPVSAMVKTAALVCLVKFMIASSDFCRANLPLLFTVLARRDQSDVDKVNLVIALGDLCCVHANLLLPYMKMSDSGFYSLLGDPSIGVRGTAVQICTHLVLNDMLRVNENLHAIVRLAADEDAGIAASASAFVRHLSIKLKGNIGNYIPPLVAKLSTAMPSDSFQVTMKHLLDKVEKDKPTESLIEKLCSRFVRYSETKKSVRTLCHNLAFCLSELNFSSERTVKKILCESAYASYKQWLRDEEVRTFFSVIVRKAKHAAGPERRDRATIDEWEARMLEDANTMDPPEEGGAIDSGVDSDAAPAQDLKGLIDDSTDEEDGDAQPRASRGSGKVSATRGSTSSLASKKSKNEDSSSSSSGSSSSSDGDDSSEEEDEEDAQPKPKKKPTAKKAAPKKPATKKTKIKKEVEESESEEDEGTSSASESESPPRRKQRMENGKSKSKPKKNHK